MDLIRRSQSGDEAAFTALFQEYQGLVFKTAYLMMGSAEEAEDVLQEVFLQVHRALHTYDPAKGAFTTWLHRITVNHCLNRRRKWRPPTISLNGPSPVSLPDPAPPPEGRLEDEEVWRSLNRLSEKLRAVVVLRYYWELSYDEIGRVLGIPVGTAKSRLDLALKTLRKELAATANDAPDSSPFPQRGAT